MVKSKRKERRDRLSELPDSLIFHIFWFLPMKYVVRTTVLSSRWKFLWTTTPYLNFARDLYDCVTVVKHRNFINRALLSWRGIKILKLFIYLYNVDEFGVDLDIWIRLAVDKKVEELYLLGNEPYDKGDFKVPQCLFSCSSLKVLSFIYGYVEITGNVQWSQLKSLTIDDQSFRGDYVINQVLCGAPQLEVLILALLDSKKNLSIRSSRLRKLSIENWHNHDNPIMSTELRIWTPNLETLEISGMPYGKCLLMNVSSLTRATLDFYGTEMFGEVSSEDDFLGETMRHIFLTIQHVEMVTLSGWCIKVLAHLAKKRLVSPFSNVKLLKLKIRFVGYEQLVGVLEIFPKMKMLVVDEHEYITPAEEEEEEEEDLDEFHRRLHKFDEESCLKFVANLPKSFLSQLRTVTITWEKGDDSIFPFIEILLKYASHLEKMVIRVIRLRPPSTSLFLASQKLLNMPRSSPNCTVDFL